MKLWYVTTACKFIYSDRCLSIWFLLSYESYYFINYRIERQIFFIVDSEFCRNEADDPKDAIMYFYPPDVRSGFEKSRNTFRNNKNVNEELWAEL